MRAATIVVSRVSCRSASPVLALAVLTTQVSLLIHGAVAAAGILTPPGLLPGDQFRTVFITDGDIPASSGDVAVYDAFAASNATLGGLDTYNGAAVIWRAIVSTIDGVDAVDQVPLDTIPLYRVDGQKIAEGGSALWTFNLPILAALNLTQFGTTRESEVWTGTNQIGTGFNRLGQLNFPQTGDSSLVTGNQWVFSGNRFIGTPLPIYAVSDVLTVVPEPATVVLATLGLVGLGVYGWRQRKR